jgi:transcriptional regulator with XRE-family HTH domain
MSTLGERIKIVQIMSGLKQPKFAKSLGVSKESLIHYQKDRRHPDSVFLSNLCIIYKINPAWLLLGEGENAIGEEGKAAFRADKDEGIAPVVLLLKQEEERAGVTLSPEQRTAILKILWDLVDRDIRSIRELLGSMKVNNKKEIT